MLKEIKGTIADSSQFDNGGTANAKVTKGSHKGHTITLSTSKFNCGAYWETLDCSCESHWRNKSGGCWDHQRDEHGDNTLKEMLREFYQALE